MEERLQNVFSQALNVPASKVRDDLQYHSIPEWNSIGHMMLIGALEDEFGISIDSDDVVNMNNVAAIKEVLKKYGIQ